jgi:hypothetical protein
MPATPLRATSTRPSGTMNAMKCSTLPVLPAISKMKLAAPASITLARADDLPETFQSTAAFAAAQISAFLLVMRDRAGNDRLTVNTLPDFGSLDSITLNGVAPSKLAADDFVFG